MNNIAAETKPQYIVWHKNGLRIPKSDRWGNILKDEECFIAPNRTIIPDNLVAGDIERQSAFEEMWISDLARKIIPSRALRADQFVCYLEMFGKTLLSGRRMFRPNIEGNIYRIHVIIRHSWNEFLMGNAAGLLNIFLRNPYTIESLEIIRDQIIKNMRDRDGGSHWDTYDDRLIDDINRIIEFKRMTILDHKLLGLWPGMDNDI